MTAKKKRMTDLETLASDAALAAERFINAAWPIQREHTNLRAAALRAIAVLDAATTQTLDRELIANTADALATALIKGEFDD